MQPILMVWKHLQNRLFTVTICIPYLCICICEWCTYKTALINRQLHMHTKWAWMKAYILFKHKELTLKLSRKDMFKGLMQKVNSCHIRMQNFLRTCINKLLCRLTLARYKKKLWYLEKEVGRNQMVQIVIISLMWHTNSERIVYGHERI